MRKNIQINGEIVSDDYGWLYDWFEIPCAYPKKIRNALQDVTGADELVLEINSVGGSVFAGFEIYSLIRSAVCRTTAFVQSLAASAASTIMVACDDVRMSPVAQVMIHQPATVTDGNIDEHKASTRFLQRIEESILNGYVSKCGQERRPRLKALMDAETWLTAEDAMELGLCDGLWADEDPAVVATNPGGAIAGGVTNGTELHDPAELLARYEEAVRNGAAPAEGHPVAPAANMQQSAAPVQLGLIPDAAEMQQGGSVTVFACSNQAEEPEDKPETETVEVSAGLEPWQMEALVEIERQR